MSTDVRWTPPLPPTGCLSRLLPWLVVRGEFFHRGLERGDSPFDGGESLLHRLFDGGESLRFQHAPSPLRRR